MRLPLIYFSTINAVLASANSSNLIFLILMRLSVLIVEKLTNEHDQVLMYNYIYPKVFQIHLLITMYYFEHKSSMIFTEMFYVQIIPDFTLIYVV